MPASSASWSSRFYISAGTRMVRIGLLWREAMPPGLGEVFGSGESGLDALSVHDAAGRGEAVAVVAAGAGVSGDEVPVGATS